MPRKKAPVSTTPVSVPDRGQVSEWYHIRLSQLSQPESPNTPSGETWTSVLQIARVQEGCTNVRWARHVEDRDRAWLLLVWKNITYSAAFKASELYNEWLAKIMNISDDAAPSPPEIHHIYIIGHRQNMPLIYDTSSNVVYEIYTFYFPVRLTADMISHCSNCYGIFQIFSGTDDPGAKAPDSLAMMRGWVEEEVIWKGKKARAFAYLMTWRSQEAEEQFKAYWHWGQQLAVDDFIESFEKVGTLGFEDSHGYFT